MKSFLHSFNKLLYTDHFNEIQEQGQILMGLGFLPLTQNFISVENFG